MDKDINIDKSAAGAKTVDVRLAVATACTGLVEAKKIDMGGSMNEEAMSQLLRVIHRPGALSVLSELQKAK